MQRALCVTVVATSFLGLTAGGAEATGGAAQPSDHTTLIRDVRLFDGTRITPSASVVFANGVIVAAGAQVAIPGDAEVIDGTGKTLLPGFIDAHTHAFPGALERALRFGVTTELDMFTSPQLAATLRVEQAAGNVATRADIRSASALVTVPGGHGTEYGPTPTFTPGADPQAFVDACIAAGSDYIKIIYDAGTAYGLTWPTLTKSDLAALIAAAHKRHKLAIVHIGTQTEARAAIEASADALAHLFGDTPPGADFGTLVAKHKAFVTATLTVIESASGVQSGASLATDARLLPYLSADEIHMLQSSFPKRAGATEDVANAFAAVRLLKAAQVPILAGTDAPNPGTAHGASIHRELELLVQGGLTPTEALIAATSAPAAAFHLTDRGRIAKGMRADLVLVNGDPTTDIQATRDIAAIWKGGVALQRQPEPKQAPAVVAAIDPQLLAAGTLSNFDSGATTSAIGFGWQLSTDQIMGGKSEATMNIVAGGANATPKALRIDSTIREGFAFPWAGPMLFLGATPMVPADLSSRGGLAFEAKGNGDFKIMVFAQSLGRIPWSKTLHASAEWSAVTIPWSEMSVTGKDIQAVLFSGAQPGSVSFEIDELRLQ